MYLTRTLILGEKNNYYRNISNNYLWWISKEFRMPSPRIKICGIGLYIFVSISQQTMGVEDKLVWGKENCTKRAFDAFGSRGVVS